LGEGSWRPTTWDVILAPLADDHATSRAAALAIT
jgi:hypothetical protein